MSMPAYEFERVRPVVDPGAYVHPSAVLIGDVLVGPGCFIGPCAVLRGDLGRLVLKAGSNVQDCCVLHCFPGKEIVLEERAHVGHGAVLHGCVVGPGALVGMHAVVMDGATLGQECLVAALSLVREGTNVPARALVAGSPARFVRTLGDDELAWKRDGTREYARLTASYLTTCREVEPLAAPEPGRPSLPQASHKPRHEIKPPRAAGGSSRADGS